MKGLDLRGVRLDDIERLCQHIRDGGTVFVLPKGWAFQSIRTATVYSKDGAEEIGQTCELQLSLRYDVEPPTVAPAPPAVRDFDPVAEADTPAVVPAPDAR